MDQKEGASIHGRVMRNDNPKPKARRRTVRTSFLEKGGPSGSSERLRDVGAGHHLSEKGQRARLRK